MRPSAPDSRAGSHARRGGDGLGLGWEGDRAPAEVLALYKAPGSAGPGAAGSADDDSAWNDDADDADAAAGSGASAAADAAAHSGHAADA